MGRSKQLSRKRRHEKGFTLIELMAVLAILAVIVAIAVPAIGTVMAKSGASAEKSSIELMERAGELAHLDGLAFDDEVNERYQIPTLVSSGYLKLETDSKFNRIGHQVEKQDNGTFVYLFYIKPFASVVVGASSWTAPADGTYLVEVWGAQGGRGGAGGESSTYSSEPGFKGDYAKTEVTVTQGTVFALRLGGQGLVGGTASGGGAGGGGGGGTDVSMNGTMLLSAKGGRGGDGGGGIISYTQPRTWVSGGLGGYNGGMQGESITSKGKYQNGGQPGGKTFISSSPVIDSSKNKMDVGVRSGAGSIAITFVK